MRAVAQGLCWQALPMMPDHQWRFLYGAGPNRCPNFANGRNMAKDLS